MPHSPHVTELSLLFRVGTWVPREKREGHEEFPCREPMAALGCAASHSQGLALTALKRSLPWKRGHQDFGDSTQCLGIESL